MGLPTKARLATLRQYEPWQRNVEPFKGDRESYENYGIKVQEETLRDLGLDDDDFGEQEQFDDGILIGTVDAKV
jgi:hypothetical protein